MRVIDRRNVGRPEVFHSSLAMEYRSQVQEYLDSASREERPPRFPSSLLRDKGLRHAMYLLFGDNCAYCEDHAGSSGGVDFFRPLHGASGWDEGIAFQHYCWLGLDWENMYFICANCNRAKGNYFPAKTRGPVGATISQLRKIEKETLLDPCWDAPSEHLRITFNGELLARTERGDVTIKILDLNRSDLVYQRAEVVRRLASASVPLHDKIRSLLPETPHSGAAWIFLLEHVPPRVAQDYRRNSGSPSSIVRLLERAFPSGGRSFGSVKYSETQEARRRYVRSVRVRNFRGIREAVLKFPDIDPERRKSAGSVVVLGDNGVGKTSLLQAAALGCLGPNNAIDAGVKPRWCLSEDASEGEVEVAFWGTDLTNIVRFNARSEIFHGEAPVPVMVLGYGAYRLAARRRVGAARRSYDHRIRSLFYERELVNGAYGLAQHLTRVDGRPDTDRLEDATRALNAVLQGRAKAHLSPDHRLIVDDNGRLQPLDELSSGYKSIVALTADIMDVMYEVWSGMTSAQAFILIDEIDAHLHPSWRLAIVDALRNTFPSAQFLMTTHDPLPLRGLADGEVVIIDREEGEVSLDVPPVRGLDGMSVDQILTSDLFGLDTTLDTETSALLARYYSYLSRQELGAGDQEALQALQEALPKQVPLGDTPRERLMYRIADAYLAKHRDVSVENLSDETIGEMITIFEAAESEMLRQDDEFEE